jgi:hypothetical protein
MWMPRWWTRLVGLRRNFMLRGRAPAHYPCSESLAAGQPLEIVPHLGWANAVPDSRAEGSVTLADGTRYELGEGAVGYHDHNLGDIPFPETIRSWYWGHAHVGEWSLVFFNGIAADGERFADSYVAQGSRVIVVDCGPDSVDVKDVTATKGAVLPVLEVRYALPYGKMLTVEVMPVSVNAFVEGVYERFVVSVPGGVVGGENSTGIGMFGHFLQQGCAPEVSRFGHCSTRQPSPAAEFIDIVQRCKFHGLVITMLKSSLVRRWHHQQSSPRSASKQCVRLRIVLTETELGPQ